MWSNCLAAWLLGGGGALDRFVLLCIAATLMYVGGMYWNDAFDVAFDRKHRPERPIPSGTITEREVWWMGGVMIGAGFLMLATLGAGVARCGLMLMGSIILYDAVHKRTVFSPLIMAACRFFLFLAAGAAAVNGIDGWVLWSASVLAIYIVGLSYIAKVESDAGPLGYWPMYLLAAPLILSFFMNDGPYRAHGLILAAPLLFWVLKSLRCVIAVQPPQIGAAVGGLLAGICLVDLAAVGSSSPVILSAFFGLFLASRIFQRFIPAT
ncbi:MAG TPA: UbiA family prenyltransferase [Roseimicrobium sp.]|nr:UbiA family prenyltransferase [Roseimicrobium sp.]